MRVSANYHMCRGISKYREKAVRKQGTDMQCPRAPGASRQLHTPTAVSRTTGWDGLLTACHLYCFKISPRVGQDIYDWYVAKASEASELIDNIHM